MNRRSPRSPRVALAAVGTSMLVCGAGLGFWVGSATPDTAPAAQPSPEAAPAAELTLPTDPAQGGSASWSRPTALFPVTLDIPSIQVSTPVMQLGLRPDRTVQVPSDPDQAGWFRDGPAPGRRGSSVILGHVDSDEGPAVFARLDELEVGDQVTVTRADDSTVSFTVRKKVLYANEEFPARLVYGRQGERRLNLVTCAGAYDSDRGGYQSNLVVYARHG